MRAQRFKAKTFAALLTAMLGFADIGRAHAPASVEDPSNAGRAIGEIGNPDYVHRLSFFRQLFWAANIFINTNPAYMPVALFAYPLDELSACGGMQQVVDKVVQEEIGAVAIAPVSPEAVREGPFAASGLRLVDNGKWDVLWRELPVVAAAESKRNNWLHAKDADYDEMLLAFTHKLDEYADCDGKPPKVAHEFIAAQRIWPQFHDKRPELASNP